MRKTPEDMVNGYVHETKTSGKIEIVEYINYSNVLVRFLETGSETKTRADKIRLKWVKDVTARSVCGVGYFGVGGHKSKLKGKHTKCYLKWRSMISRCYSEYSLKTKPTYKGCVVCEEWHNFQNFAEWFYANYPDDGNDYDLDKDIKSGNRVGKLYSPDHCCFVSSGENTAHSHAKSYELIDPQGNVHLVKNLADFCRSNNLTDSLIHHVISGLQHHHKGWKVKRQTSD